jgi:predicted O-methyltransferase YrrM
MERIFRKMNVTERMMQLDPTLELHNEGEWSNTVSEFSAFNDGGVECEVGEYLYSLLRLMKPERILETGTHLGIGASYMGMALKDNAKGIITTIEFIPELRERAMQRFAVLDLEDFVMSVSADATKFVPDALYDVVFLDTEPQTRFFELLKYFPFVKQGGFIFIHDLNRHMHQVPNAEHGFAWPYGKLPEEIKSLVASGQLRPFHFTTPRGLTGFYKVAWEDYKWTEEAAL